MIFQYIQKHTFSKQKTQKGFVLLFAVTIAAILLSVALGVSNVALKEMRFSSSGRDTNNAFLAADVGSECALANDKLSATVFPIAGPATNISCAGSTITPVFTGTANTGSYDFVVPSLGSSGTACAKVNITKDQSVSPTSVVVTSTGYNVGDGSCNSTNPNRTERKIKVTSYVGNPPASVTGFLVDNAGTLTTSLISYWKLDETSGTRIDSKGSNNMTVTNGVSYAGGKMGNAGVFTEAAGAEDRASQTYLQVADNASISAGDTNFTFGGWVYMGAKSHDMSIVAKGDSGAANEFNLKYNSSSDRFEFWVHNGSALTSILASNFGAPSINTWYYVVAWHDATNNQLGIQINNGTANTSSYSNGVQDNTSRFLIGTWQDTPNQEWVGRIDELGFWRKILSTQEKTDLYNSGGGNTYLYSGGGSTNPTITYSGTSSGSVDVTSGPLTMSTPGTYSLTTNISFTAIVKCWGAGGGGGATKASATYVGGGGGGGGGFFTTTTVLAPGAVYNMVVGAFGARGTWTEANEAATYSGSNGGNSSFGSYIAYGGSGGLKGGSGGTGGQYGSYLGGTGYNGGTGGNGATWNGSAGGAGGGGGGAGSGGNGGNGANGTTSTMNGGAGGSGGSADGGAGGNGQYNATAAAAPGGGGGGGNPASGGAVHGIDGANGRCVITKQ